MKTRFLIIVGIIIITISGLYVSIGLNQNDTRLISNIDCSDGAIQVWDKCVPFNSKEKIDYDDLVTRKVLAVSAPATEIIPERNCHKFSLGELASIPAELEYVINESILQYSDDHDGDGFYDGFGNEVSFDTAKSFLEKYDFALTTETREWGMQEIPDTKYTFECIFEDDSHQYKLGFVFDSHYDIHQRVVFVNFTQNNIGNPIIQNKDTTIFGGGFNGTVAFANKLDHPITMSIQNPPTDGDWTEHLLPNSVTIPAGKVWSHHFRNFHSGEDLVYTYFISPENLDGKVTFKNYPRCMTESEVLSLYSQVKVNPTFPTYLPEGYSFECGIHNTNWSVFLVYLDDDGRKKMLEKDHPVFHFARTDLVESKALIINYWDGFAANYWQQDQTYDKYEKQKDSSGFKASKMITVADQPSVLHIDYFPNRISSNTLSVFSDNATTITISGNFTDDELVKVGESLFQIIK